MFPVAGRDRRSRVKCVEVVSGAGGVAREVERLPSKREALSSKPGFVLLTFKIGSLKVFVLDWLGTVILLISAS
jgi:hypothetical protein